MDKFALADLPISKSKLVVKVKPNSPKTKIISIGPDCIKMEVKAPPENNKANIEIIKFFSKLSKKNVKILFGLTSKTKTVSFS